MTIKDVTPKEAPKKDTAKVADPELAEKSADAIAILTPPIPPAPVIPLTPGVIVPKGAVVIDRKVVKLPTDKVGLEEYMKDQHKHIARLEESLLDERAKLDAAISAHNRVK